MQRAKVTAVTASGLYVQTADLDNIGPCQAVTATYAVGEMVLVVNVGDENRPDLVVVGKVSATGSLSAIADGSVTSAKIADGTIVNADISGSAAIARSKISGLPTSSTDNTIPKFDSTGGALQTSGIVVDDNNRLRVASGSSGGLEVGSSGVLHMSGTGGPSGISAPVGSTWRQTDANTSHGSLTGLLWNKVGTGTTEGTDWLVDYEGRWATYTPTWTNVTMSSNNARYTVTGKTCHLLINSSLSAAPSGSVTVTLPTAAPMSAYVQSGQARLIRSSSYNGAWVRDSSSTIKVGYWTASNVYANLSSTLPAAWASGDIISLSATYELTA